MRVDGLKWVQDPEAGDIITYHGLCVGYVTRSERGAQFKGWASNHGIVAEGDDLEDVRAKLFDHVTEIAIKNGARPLP